MTNVAFDDARSFIEAEIQKYLPLIGRKSEITDKFLKAKVIALVEALEGINEYGDDIDAYGKHILRLYRANQGKAESLHTVLIHLNVAHQYVGKRFPALKDAA